MAPPQQVSCVIILFMHDKIQRTSIDETVCAFETYQERLQGVGQS